MISHQAAGWTFWIDPTVAWVCERALRYGAGGRPTHVPDGVVVSATAKTAVEVELTPKTEERVRDILRLLLDGYDRVAYFAPRAGAVVRRAGTGLHGRLVIRAYPITGGRGAGPPAEA